MVTLVRIKDWLKAVYGRFDVIIITVMKFLLAFAALRIMSKYIGFFDLFTNPFVSIVIALVCSLLPFGLSAAVLALCFLANLYKISIELAILAAFILMVIALLYYSFHPGDAVLLILMPVLMALKVPYVIPLIAGLAGSIFSIIPISFGVLIFYIAQYANANAELLSGKLNLTQMPANFMTIIDGIIPNKTMWMGIAIFAITVIVVYLIHNLSFNYSWYVATGVGAIGLLLMSLILDSDIQVVGFIVSIVIAAVYIFFVFSVDYKKTERIQFEDDEYYYYVKAIPKITENTLTEKKSYRNRDYDEQ